MLGKIKQTKLNENFFGKYEYLVCDTWTEKNDLRQSSEPTVDFINCIYIYIYSGYFTSFVKQIFSTCIP